jgi:two-component system cell cycle sensor histidine kinase PleC
LDAKHAALQSAYLSKNRLFAGVSHDLASPLNAILGFSEILKGGDSKKPKNFDVSQYATYIHQSGQQLTDLVQQILEISTIEEGMWKPEDEPIHLNTLLNELTPVLCETLSQAGMALRVDVPVSLPNLIADQLALKRVLTNLVTNCTKYSGGHTVTIAAAKTDAGNLVVSVADDGKGIPKDKIQVLREFRVRAESGSTASTEGLGIGLWLVDTLMEAHDAIVKFEETPTTGGLTVTIEFSAMRVAAHS